VSAEWKKGKKTGHLVCNQCGTKSKEYPCPTSAPALDLCEAARAQEGWGYTVGIQAMMLGPVTLCPRCARPSEYAEKRLAELEERVDCLESKQDERERDERIAAR
jgi:hypothetical protein